MSTLINFNRLYGIFRSLRAGYPLNGVGESIPWFTYPAIEYLASFNFDDKAVFEYGSGQSTMYWSRRCRKVISVEHDPEWFEWVKTRVPNNTEVVLALERNEYVQAIERDGAVYDIVVIDGMWRVDCVSPTLRHLKNNGLIILDNADWYPSITNQLREAGFLEIDFNGFAPLNRFGTTTSFFFKEFVGFQDGFRNPAPVGGRRGGEFLESQWKV